CPLRHPQRARPNVQVARNRVRDTRSGHGPARHYTFLLPVSRRPAFHRTVPEAQRAVTCYFRKAMSEKPSFFSELKQRNVRGLRDDPRYKTLLAKLGLPASS